LIKGGGAAGGQSRSNREAKEEGQVGPEGVVNEKTKGCGKDGKKTEPRLREFI